MNTTYPEILTPEQVADYLQVNRETVYRYIRDGRLNASRIGRSYRIRRQNIELLLESTSARPDIKPRLYSDRQLNTFLAEDALDDVTRSVITSMALDGITGDVNESR